jgi:mRNA interferase RelE/StbE
MRIRWERRAVKELAGLPRKDRRRVVEAVEALLEDPLAGEPLAAQWKGLRRLHVGRYRVLYGFDGKELLIAVVRVGHRKDIYR